MNELNSILVHDQLISFSKRGLSYFWIMSENPQRDKSPTSSKTWSRSGIQASPANVRLITGTKWAFHRVAIAGAIILAPYHVVKLLQLIWR